MADALKTLTEASPASLLLLAGLAFLALGILGGYAGKFQLSPGPRWAAAALGAAFMAGGFWMLQPAELKIVFARVDIPGGVYDGPCPVDVELNGVVNVKGSGKVVYRFLMSDNQRGRDQVAAVDAGNPGVFRDIWTVKRAQTPGWAELNFSAPYEDNSPHSEPVFVTCAPAPTRAAASGPPAPSAPALDASASASRSVTVSATDAPAPPAPGALIVADLSSGVAGRWIEANPRNAASPLRLAVVQNGPQIIALGQSFALRDGVAQVSVDQPCAAQFQRPGAHYENGKAGVATISLRRQGPVLIYTIETQWDSACDGHAQGREAISYELRRDDGP